VISGDYPGLEHRRARASLSVDGGREAAISLAGGSCSRFARQRSFWTRRPGARTKTVRVAPVRLMTLRLCAPAIAGTRTSAPRAYCGAGYGGSRRIVFSNGSRARLFGVSTLSDACVLCVLVRHLMGSAGCRAARLKSQSASGRPRATESAPSSAPSLGRRSSWELDTASCLVACWA
jgi:hypothetical protein